MGNLLVEWIRIAGTSVENANEKGESEGESDPMTLRHESHRRENISRFLEIEILVELRLTEVHLHDRG